MENIRTLTGCDPDALVRGSIETGSEAQLSRSPKIIIPADHRGENCVFEAASYGRSPGHGLTRVQALVGNPLPDDFLAFYEQYETALVVTRTFPLHLWSEDKMIEGIKWHREFYDKPFRVLRFGDQYDRNFIYFALWLEDIGTKNWRVIATDHGSIDDMDDDHVDSGQIIGNSFYEWLKSWVERDGLPDPFMEIGEDGGFNDPPTDEDWARARARQASK